MDEIVGVRMPNHQIEVGGNNQMETARSSRSSSSDEIEYDAKMRDVNQMDTTVTSLEFQTSENGDSTSARHEAASRPKEKPDLQQCDAAGRAEEEDMAMELSRKIYKSGLGDVRAQGSHGMSGCSDCEDEESDNDDDLCSTSSDDCEEFSFDPLASGVMLPVLPDIQLSVPMEDGNDVQRVRNALLIKGVLEVACDQERQIVTVTGTVHPSRLLKKVRKVKRQAQIISTVTPFARFLNHSRLSPAFALEELETDDTSEISGAIDIPSPGPPVPNFVVHQQRPRPAFQRYTFHNDAHSPYLRTFSPSDLSPVNSPSTVVGDVFDHHGRRNGFPFLDDEFFQENGVIHLEGRNH